MNTASYSKRERESRELHPGASSLFFTARRMMGTAKKKSLQDMRCPAGRMDGAGKRSSALIAYAPDAFILADSGEYRDVCAGLILHPAENAAVLGAPEIQVQING